MSDMTPSFLNKQGAQEPGAAVSKRLVAALGLAILVFAVFYLVSPNWPWQTPVSDDDGFVTRVDIARLSAEKVEGDAAPVIFVHAKNSSKRPAKAITLALSGNNADSQLLPIRRAKDPLHAGVSLEPGQELKIPVVSVADFLAAFQSKCPGCYFLGVGPTAAMPVELTAQLCSGILEKGRSCHLEYSIVPIALARQFKTVFGESVSGGKTVFVYLSRNFKTEYSVPKT